MIEVHVAEYDSKDWQTLISKSHQTSLYVTPEWMAIHPHRCYIAYKGNNVAAGIVVNPGTHAPYFIPYQGVLQLHKEDHKVVGAMLEAVQEDFDDPISVWNPPSLVDTRPFGWQWFTNKVLWTPTIKFTYFCTPASRMEPRARANITGKQVEKTCDPGWFDEWKKEPWVGALDEEIMERVLGFTSTECWTDGDGWVVWGTDLQDRGYYLASVGKPTNVLAFLINECPSTDLVGCNSPQRALFKRSFGGILRTYYGYRTA